MEFEQFASEQEVPS